MSVLWDENITKLLNQIAPGFGGELNQISPSIDLLVVKFPKYMYFTVTYYETDYETDYETPEHANPETRFT